METLAHAKATSAEDTRTFMVGIVFEDILEMSRHPCSAVSRAGFTK